MAVSRAHGGSVRRREDPRMVTGAGRYTSDVAAGALHACFVRSPFAHAKVGVIEVEGARSTPGVVAVFVAADLALKPQEFPSLDTMSRPPLAGEVVRFVGDAVALVVAETRGSAVDAAEAVIVEYDPLPALIDPSAAMAD